MKVAIIAYNAGNVSSVQNALQRAGVETVITNNADIIRAADKVIFPGVGHAAAAMQDLKAHKLDVLIPLLTQPVLGICLGLQLMCRSSEEGGTSCLSIFDAEVRLFHSPELKVPQVGWNNIVANDHTLFAGLPGTPFVYYVHSYFAEQCAQTIATTDYILPYSAALQKDNFYAVQFHPEKSGPVGERILHNFLNIDLSS